MKSTKRLAYILSLVPLAMASGLFSRALAATYNAVTQFSIKANSDTSLWSYRVNSTGVHDNNYSLLPESGNINKGVFLVPNAKASVGYSLKVALLPCWVTTSNPSGPPSVCANKTDYNVLEDGTLGSAIHSNLVSPAQHIRFHPPMPGLTVVSFLAPATGLATIQYDFTPIDYSCSLPSSGYTADGIVWSVDSNTTILATGTLQSTSATDVATTGSQTISAQVSKGDRINFTIAPNNGNANCDTTVLSASITLQ